MRILILYKKEECQKWEFIYSVVNPCIFLLKENYSKLVYIIVM